MSRAKRRFLLSIFVVLSAIILILWWLNAPQHSDTSGVKNAQSVLLVTLDTVRADRLEPYGAEDVETPVLAELARQGILFERAYAVAPITLVAHASLLTGAYPPDHGVRNNGTYSLRREWTTLPEILSEHGLRTAAFISATVLEARYGLDGGFEVYDEDLRSQRASAGAVYRLGGATVDAARHWMDGLGSDERFFAWVHLFDPHAPYDPPAPFRERYKERPYDGEIAYVDREIGRLLDHPVFEHGQVAVVVLGDHGESMGDHGEETHGMLPYDATLRIPWILRLPASTRGMKAGVRSQTPIDQTDLPAMVLDILGIQPADDWTGMRMPEIDREPSAVPRSLYAETYMPFLTYGWSPLRILRRGQWKYVEAPTPELYNLESDPGESTNQIAEWPEVAHQLSGELERKFGILEDEVSTAGSTDLDQETAERLRSLGYLGSAGQQQLAQTVDPKEAIDLHVSLEWADQAVRARRLDDAIVMLKEALARDPNNLRALSDLARAQAYIGAIDQGVDTLERAISIAPRNPQLHLQLAAFEEERARPEAALRHLDMALAIRPEFLEARLEKASYLDDLGRFEESAGELHALLEQVPQHAEANALYALLVEVRGGQEVAAEMRLRRTLKRDPYLGLAWHGLGKLLERAGRLEEAIRAYRSGLARRNDDGELHAALGLLLARTNGGTETAKHLREAIDLLPGPRPDLQQALEGSVATHTQASSTESLHTRNERAVTLYQEGDQAGAVEALTTLLAEHPGYTPAHVNLSWIALQSGDWAAAEQYAEQALEADPANHQAWMNLGQAHESRARLSDAESAYRHALDLVPDAWLPRLSLAILELKSGNAEVARRQLEEVERRAANNPDARLRLATAYLEGLNDEARARVHYEALLRLAPDHPAADEVRRRLARTLEPGIQN